MSQLPAVIPTFDLMFRELLFLRTNQDITFVLAVVYYTHRGPLETSGMLHLQEKEGSCPFLRLKVMLSKSKRTKNLNAYNSPGPDQLPSHVLK